MRAELEALERDFRGQAESAESPEEAETFCYCADRLATLRAGVVGEDVGALRGSPPEPVAFPNAEWCDLYASWYYGEPSRSAFGRTDTGEG